MNALVVYASQFGNTKQVAEAIGAALAEHYAVRVVSVDEAVPLTDDLDLLVVGGPTQAHGASHDMKALLESIDRGALAGVPVAAFDTRFQMPRWLAGSAAEAIGKRLRQGGGTLLLPPESFFVERAQEGPLKPGERERAQDWARQLLATMPRQPAAR